MIIYKGQRFTISHDGANAVKSDGKSIRSGRYYPERDVTAIAGMADELTAWQILRDVASQLIDGKSTPVSPAHIFIDGDSFHLSEWSESLDAPYVAQEGYEPVWALAATVFFVYLGVDVFQGGGGKAQKAGSPIPVMRRELQALSSLVGRALSFDPSQRPSLDEIVSVADAEIERCRLLLPSFPQLKFAGEQTDFPSDSIDQLWPEEFS